MYFNYRTPFDTSVCYTDGVILFKYHIITVLLLLWQNKRLDAQSKN